MKAAQRTSQENSANDVVDEYSLVFSCSVGDITCKIEYEGSGHVHCIKQATISHNHRDAMFMRGDEMILTDVPSYKPICIKFGLSSKRKEKDIK